MPRNGKPRNLEQAREYNQRRKVYRQFNEYTRRGGRRRHAKLRMEVLKAYGGEHPRCSCECGCQEDCFLLLDLDHVNNDGAEHRRLLSGKHGGKSFYRALKKLGWPNDPPIRVLCVSCNVGRQRNCGQCPRLGIIENDRRTPLPHKRFSPETPPPETPLFDIMGEPWSGNDPTKNE